MDSVGTVPASLLTYAAALALQPDLIINAGTAGGFQVLHYFLSSHLVEFLCYHPLYDAVNTSVDASNLMLRGLWESDFLRNWVFPRVLHCSWHFV